MINKTSNKTSTTKPSESKKKPEATEWLFANIAEASKNARKIYFLFIGFLVYCGITVVGTSDRQIILNDAVSLPILRMDVPLNGFFILAPMIAIFVFIYLQLYLSIRKDLINDLKVNYPQTGRKHLYPWMLIALDYPKKDFIGRLQSVVVKFSVWCSAPLVLIIISTWFVKKHDPILSYIIGSTPIFGTIIVIWFWNRYEKEPNKPKAQLKVKLKKFQILRFIAKNWGKNILILFIVLYEIALFSFITQAKEGFPDAYISHIKSFFCLDLSNQKIITEPDEDKDYYPQIYWLDLSNAHLEGANLESTVLKRADLREAHLQNARMINAILQEANLQEANLQEANLSEANLSEANLFRASLYRADLSGADLRRATLIGADLIRANLEETDLRGAIGLFRIMLHSRNWLLAFYNENLLAELGLPSDHNDRVKQRNFSEYNLSGADLSNADLSNADLRGADLQGADLRGVDLHEAKNLTINQLAVVKTLYKAKLDPNLRKQIEEKYPHLLKMPKPEKKEK